MISIKSKIALCLFTFLVSFTVKKQMKVLSCHQVIGNISLYTTHLLMQGLNNSGAKCDPAAVSALIGRDFAFQNNNIAKKHR